MYEIRLLKYNEISETQNSIHFFNIEKVLETFID